MKFTDLDSKRKRLLAIQSVTTCILLKLARENCKGKTEDEVLEMASREAEGLVKSINDEQVDTWLQYLDLESNLVNLMDLKQ